LGMIACAIEVVEVIEVGHEPQTAGWRAERGGKWCELDANRSVSQWYDHLSVAETHR
jgi:hypothetical protein